jgi:hypothetical protein
MKNLFIITLSLIALFSFLSFESSFAGVLAYSTYLGGGSGDWGLGITIDSSGNVYITGGTSSTDFPTTTGAFDTSFNGSVVYTDVFVTKVDSTGTALVYSTYLGGGSADGSNGIAIDSSGNVYITGLTNSTNFPITPGAFDTSFNGGSGDVFVSKLNASGTALLYSTYLGGVGIDGGQSIAIDGSGNAYITGYTWSSNFPTTLGALDTSFNGGSRDVFVTKLNTSGTALVYSTYLGGSGTDFGDGIAVDGSENAYITGSTPSTNFPTTPGVFDTLYNGGVSYGDIFVTKLNASGTALVYSTYLGGGSDDGGSGIAVDGSGNAYISGGTMSSNFPTTLGALDTSYNGVGDYDVFLSKLNPSGTALVYSTYLGGGGSDGTNGIAIDGSGNAYITGQTSSSDFPTTLGAFNTLSNGSSDGFVTKLNPSGTALVYSTYLGGVGSDWGTGIALDGSGNAYITGETQSSNFPTTPGAFDTTFNGNYDVFVTKLSLVFPLSVQEWMRYEE